MNPKTNVPAQKQVLDSLNSEVKSTEDKAVLDGGKAEYETERAEIERSRLQTVNNLGAKAAKFYVLNDGVVEPVENLKAAIDDGQDVTLHNTAGRSN